MGEHGLHRPPLAQSLRSHPWTLAGMELRKGSAGFPAAPSPAHRPQVLGAMTPTPQSVVRTVLCETGMGLCPVATRQSGAFIVPRQHVAPLWFLSVLGPQQLTGHQAACV